MEDKDLSDVSAARLSHLMSTQSSESALVS